MKLLRRWIRGVEPLAPSLKMAGDPLHVMKVWSQGPNDTFYIARCGARGYSSYRPVDEGFVNHAQPRCPLCFWDETAVSA